MEANSGHTKDNDQKEPEQIYNRQILFKKQIAFYDAISSTQDTGRAEHTIYLDFHNVFGTISHSNPVAKLEGNGQENIAHRGLARTILGDRTQPRPRATSPIFALLCCNQLSLTDFY